MTRNDESRRASRGNPKCLLNNRVKAAFNNASFCLFGCKSTRLLNMFCTVCWMQLAGFQFPKSDKHIQTSHLAYICHHQCAVLVYANMNSIVKFAWCNCLIANLILIIVILSKSGWVYSWKKVCFICIDICFISISVFLHFWAVPLSCLDPLHAHLSDSLTKL